MKKTLWTTYLDQLKVELFANVVFSTLLIIAVVITPVSFAFLRWYGEEVPATLVWKDPVAYPHTYKQRVEYRYYGTFHFDELNGNKQVEIQETTHSNAKIGDVYLFSRGHELQTGWRNVFMFASVGNMSLSAVLFIALICNFVSVANTYYSVKKKDTTYPYPD